MKNNLLLWLLGLAGVAFVFRDKLREKLVTGAIALNDPTRKLIERFEGRRNYAYKDSAGKWTIGVGHLIRLPEEQSLLNYTQQNPAPAAVIDKLFDQDSTDAKGIVASQVKVPLNENQRAALVSFAFNIGSGNFLKSTVLRKLNEGDFNAAADAMLLWNKAAGKPVLTARREQERTLFNSPPGSMYA